MNSVGQEFGQGLVGMAWWFHNVWGFAGKVLTVERDSAATKWNFQEFWDDSNVGLRWGCQHTYMWPSSMALGPYHMAASGALDLRGSKLQKGASQ